MGSRHNAIRGVVVAIATLWLAPNALAQPSTCLTGSGTAAISACDAVLADASAYTPSELAAYQRAMADHLLRAREFDRALAQLDDLADFDVASTQHHLARARALVELDRAEDALTALDRALQIDPQHLDALLLRGRLALGADRPDAAVADAGLATTLSPDNVDAHRLMAAALAAVGAADAADRSTDAANAIINEAPATSTAPATTTASAPATAPATTTASESTPGLIEVTFWNDVKDSQTAAELQAFIDAFPNSAFVPLARLRLQRLGGATPAAAPATPAATASLPLPETRESLHLFGPGAAWLVREIAGGDRIVIGEKTDTGRVSAWIARIDTAGAVKWEDLRPSDGQAYLTDMIVLPDGTLMVTELAGEDDTMEMRLLRYALDGDRLSEGVLSAASSRFGYAAINAGVDGPAIITTAAPGPNGADTPLITAIHPDGTTAWRQSVDGVPTGRATTSVASGGAIYVGGATGDDYAEPLPTWIVKLSPAGEVIWQRTIAEGGDQEVVDLVPVDDGGVIALVSSETKVALRRLLPNGDTRWAKVLPMPSDALSYLAVPLPGDDGYAVAGNFQVDDAGGAWILWFDADGNVLSRRYFGAKASRYIYGMTATHDGGLLVSGQSNDDWGSFVMSVAPRDAIPADAFTAAGSGLLEPCVQLAADPADTENPFGQFGDVWDDFQADTAANACRLVGAAFPTDPVAQFHLARVEHKLDRLEQAVVAYTAAVDAGHTLANQRLGDLLSLEQSRILNLPRAAELLSRAVAVGVFPDTAFLLAQAYHRGQGNIPKSREKAAEYWLIAADAGHPMSAHIVAGKYRIGDGVPMDADLAVAYYRRAIEGGQSDAAGDLALFLEFEHADHTPASELRRLYLMAAEADHVRATFEVAMAYRFGTRWLPTDHQKALVWLERAANLGAYEAYADLGFMHQFALGVPKDMDTAIDYYRRGVAEGHRIAEYYLARAYFDGNGVQNNRAEALRLFRLAADGGYNPARIRLGYMARDGIGMAADPATAYENFSDAANDGYLEASREAGWLLARGLGVAQNLTEGIRMIRAANSEPDGEAEAYLGLIFESEPEVQNPIRAAQHFYASLRLGDDTAVRRPSAAWDRAVARELQTLLKNAGYYAGVIDGSLGPASVRAMRDLCQCN